MILESGSIIKVDGNKCIVLTCISENNINYAFVNQITEDEENITDIYFVIEYKVDGSINKVTDDNLLNQLFPKIQDGLKKSMAENGIDIDSFV